MQPHFSATLRTFLRDPLTLAPDLSRILRQVDPALAAAANGFSGAELEQAIVSALYAAHAEQKPLDTDLVMHEIRTTRPLSVLMAEQVQALRDWAQDDNAHVRRLVSEGTRPRLPWAPRLPAFQNNPQLALPLLDALKDDPSSYVRRSVANHLGDIAKDHPDLAVGTACTWLQGAPAPREALVRHGLRFLIKRGDAAALDALGVGHAVALDVRAARVLPARARIGDKVRNSSNRAKPIAPITVPSLGATA